MIFLNFAGSGWTGCFEVRGGRVTSVQNLTFQMESFSV